MNQKTAIIGGGPAGLAAGRALKALGMPFDIIEQNADFGGLWNRDWALSPIYDSAHFISSRTMSAFGGFPMPEDWLRSEPRRCCRTGGGECQIP